MVDTLLARKNIAFPKGNISPEREATQSNQFKRDPHVVAYILKLANGHCEACKQQAPFQTSSGRPFLEVHHLKNLADGGSDRVSNAIAVCPNCHRAIHYSENSDQLRMQIVQRNSRLLEE